MRTAGFARLGTALALQTQGDVLRAVKRYFFSIFSNRRQLAIYLYDDLRADLAGVLRDMFPFSALTIRLCRIHRCVTTWLGFHVAARSTRSSHSQMLCPRF